MIGRFIASQFRKPFGPVGHLVGRGMARSNEAEARWTVDLLDLQPDMRVLEVGFGPGVAVAYAAQRALHVTGIDYSETMVQAARRRNAAAIQSGLVELAHGDVRSLPYHDEQFDRVFTIHCIYFWEAPKTCLREMRRVLCPGGMLAITIMPKENWQRRTPPADVFHLYHAEEVAQMLTETGYQDVRIITSPHTDTFPGQCILAVR